MPALHRGGGAGDRDPRAVRLRFCRSGAVPAGARAFRAPVAGGCVERVYYVLDDPAHCFVGNRFEISGDVRSRVSAAPVPGLSFFDRPDQQDQVKLHLPYIWRTAEGVSLLFTASVNRPRDDGLRVVSGLVECDWYASPVNLVLQLPPLPGVVHVAAGEFVAEAILVPADLRQPLIDVVEAHRRETRNVQAELRAWRELHSRDRAAYKHVSRASDGRLP